MAQPVLKYGSPAEIPKDAIRLSEKEALEMQYKTIAEWKPQSEMWPLKYGPFVLACSAIAMGMHVNSTFRHFLKLKTYARFSTYLPSTLLPAVLAFGAHNLTVTNDILLYKTPCPVCVETRAVAWQLVTGVIYPMILSPLSTLAFAAQYKTFFVPHLLQNPYDFLHLIKTVTRRMTPTLYVLIAFNVGTATIITHLEMKRSFKIGIEPINY